MKNLPAKRGRGFGGWVPGIFRENFDNVWDRFFDEFDSIFSDMSFENESGDIVYKIEVPGFNKDNISVQVSDGILEIKGERKVGEGERIVGQKSLYKRMSVGDVEDATAIVVDGILTVTLKYTKQDVKQVKVVDVQEVEEEKEE